MAQPHSQQISLDATPYYHCISRCVRRAYLCGFDCFTNTSYEHRRDLIEKHLYLLADTYNITFHIPHRRRFVQNKSDALNLNRRDNGDIILASITFTSVLNAKIHHRQRLRYGVLLDRKQTVSTKHNYRGKRRSSVAQYSLMQ